MNTTTHTIALLDIARRLSLATNEGDDVAQGTHYVDENGTIRCKGSFLALIEDARAAIGATLHKQADDTYAFSFGGATVLNPLLSACGRFVYDPKNTAPDAFTPKHYGFDICSTGGGFTAWARDFIEADTGRRLNMLVTHIDGDTHEAEGGKALFGVYDDSGACLAQWSRDGASDAEDIETNL